jgi:uncharacterized membrane protein/nitrite reductase/ring-hydroxylating ferredoxin subunit
MLKSFLQGKALGHPVHPMLVHLPIGLFLLSLLLDLTSLISSSVPYLPRSSFYAMLAGVSTALLAAIPGLADYSDIRRDHPAKRTATTHMILNLIAVALYGVNLWVRSSLMATPKISLVPLLLSLVGIGLLSVSGYLGGRLVYDDGIAVGRHKRPTSTPESTLHFSATGSGFVPVPEAERLREKETLRIDIEGQVIVLAKIDNQLFAFQEFCTHRFGPLSEGRLEECYVECPWHNSRFDVRSGKVVQGPAKVDLKTFKVEVRDGKVGILLGRQS